MLPQATRLTILLHADRRDLSHKLQTMKQVSYQRELQVGLPFDEIFNAFWHDLLNGEPTEGMTWTGSDGQLALTYTRNSQKVRGIYSGCTMPEIRQHVRMFLIADRKLYFRGYLEDGERVDINFKLPQRGKPEVTASIGGQKQPASISWQNGGEVMLRMFGLPWHRDETGLFNEAKTLAEWMANGYGDNNLAVGLLIGLRQERVFGLH